MEKQPYLSVIIPVYNEGERIGHNLLEIEKYLSDKDFTHEILVIVDGSPNNTAEVAENYSFQIKNLRVIDNKENKGKGYVVRQGLLEAKGKYRVFLDADGSTSIRHLDKFLPEFDNGFDLIIGSRNLKGSFIQIHQAKHREVIGNIGNWLIRIILGLWKYPDTQCGFKVLSEKLAEEVVSKMIVDRFGFDFELIVLSEKFGFKVKQMPVRWLNDHDSSVTLIGPNGFTRIFVDLLRIKYRLVLGKYKKY